MASLTEKKKAENQGAVLSNGALGMILFIATEVMFFSGLISAFVVNATDNAGDWPPKWQPRLPVAATGFNTLLLLASAVILFMSIQALNKNKLNLNKSTLLLRLTTLLGGAFVLLQGFEWVQLIREGLTSTSSLFGAFFYTIIGAHAIHAVFGIIYIVIISGKIIKTIDLQSKFSMMNTMSIYWYFVVFLWPVLYVLVYILPSNN